MPNAIVTFNGRITLPANVRKELGVKPGDSVEFVEVEKGRFAIRLGNGSVENPSLEIPDLHSDLAAEDFEIAFHSA